MAKEKLFHCHLNSSKKNVYLDNPPSERDKIDWRSILKALKEIDYQGGAVLETRKKRELKKGIKYLENLLRSLNSD
jgi:sugar phosphate isomerase/epimerase